jgi:predicted deacylase
MFVINEDNSIYVTRGDVLLFSVKASNDGNPYTFKVGDVVRVCVVEKKAYENVVLQKDFPITTETDTVQIVLDEQDTKIGETISKPKDYWYEIVLNPETEPQTIVGYDDDGAKIFKLFPEGEDLPETPITEEDIPIIDAELSLLSARPVENRAITREIVRIDNTIETLDNATNESISTLSDRVTEQSSEIAVERARITNLAKLTDGSTTGDAELMDIRVGANGRIYTSAGDSVREQITDVKGEISYQLLDDALWEIGGISVLGDETTNTNRVKLKKPMPLSSFICSDGYMCYVFAYDFEGNFVGGLQQDGTYTKGMAIHGHTKWNVVDNYLYRVVLFRVDDNDMTVDEVNNNTFNISRFFQQGNVLEERVERLEDYATKEEKINLISPTGTYSYINCNVPVGSEVDLTPKANNGFHYIISDCKKGDVFTVTASSGSSPRAWAFIDENNILISVSDRDVTIADYELLAPCNGKFISSYVNINPYSVKRKTKISAFEYHDNKTSHIPYVKLMDDYTLKDVSDSVKTFNFSKSGMLSKAYELFDNLVSNYKSIVTKTDIAETLGLTYPVYANGVSGSSEYEDTPAYKTYMYQFSVNSTLMGHGSTSTKKKLLIVGGLHGNETLAPFNLYLIAKQLCDGTDNNLFMLLSAFDIYMIPCVNGYGHYHQQRKNANGIDINRNFPITNWTKEEGTTYSGEVAGSEFETKVVMGAYEVIKPDFFVDAHNYGAEATWQFYTIMTDEKLRNLAYQSAVECSLAFTRCLPQYFGNKLIFPVGTESSPNYIQPKTKACLSRWCYEQGCKMSATIEVGNCINVENGEILKSGDYRDLQGANTFSVAEYTMRNQLCKYGQWVLENV